LHLAVLEPEAFVERVAIVGADDYRTKAARDARDEAYAIGKTPLLTKQLGIIAAMDRAIAANRDAAELLTGGNPDDHEVSFFWQDEQTGTPCKARVDRVTDNGRVLVDLKTAACAAPRVWQRGIFNDGHFLRAPWYRDGWEIATGIVPRRYAFIVVEKEPPHVCQVYDLDERALEWGRLVMRRALNRFVECDVAKRWGEGYGRGPITISLPTWAEYQLAERHEDGEFTAADARRSIEWMAP
jgi:hypothetical protein